MPKITLLLIGMTLGPVYDLRREQESTQELQTTGRATAGSLPDCSWPGDLDGSTGVPNVRDFAVLQRCFGLSVPASGCSPEEFRASDLRTDGAIDLPDYAAFAALGWPPPMTISCGFPEPILIERCGPECLADGDAVETSEPVVVTPRQVLPALGSEIRRIQVARDPDTLTALVDPTPLGDVDFESLEVIIFTTLVAVENFCWGTVHCYNGAVDLPDGRRAAIVGFVQHGLLICLAVPWTVTRAVVAPRSERPVVLLFIERDGHVTQTVTPICE